MKLADWLAAGRIAIAVPMVYLLYVESLEARWVATGLFGLVFVLAVVARIRGRAVRPGGIRRLLRTAATPLVLSASAIALARWGVFREETELPAYLIAGMEVIYVIAQLCAPASGRMPASNVARMIAAAVEFVFFGLGIATIAMQTMYDPPSMLIGMFDITVLVPLWLAAGFLVAAAVLAFVEPIVRRAAPEAPPAA
jgi:hypothetical protein